MVANRIGTGLLAFYAASAAFQLVGLAAFIVLAYSGVGGAAAFSKKDLQLEKAVVATPRRKRPSESGWIVPRSSDGRIPGSPVLMIGRPEPERELQREKELVDPIRQTIEIQRHSLVQIWRRSAFVAATMAISLVQNLLACGLFGRLRIQGDIPVLRTTMLYSFYISQCCGTLLVMVSRNRGFGALVEQPYFIMPSCNVHAVLADSSSQTSAEFKTVDADRCPAHTISGGNFLL